MRIGIYLVAFLVVMALLITFGNRGLVDNYLMNKQLAELKSQNFAIEKENNELKRKIILLRNDLSYLEHIARNELGMVKDGDIVYHLVK
ncbi:MAG TPA: septum formation initiator family protein [Smithellaceae bacterium]|jgi:cell division protein FtsB|nr:septum formation initiator family protein [Syntrophaceae bacterium]NMD06128.1 septum formation initiator family protein [Deltaproteobacteria bacterium]HNQ17519.1 septum formation initiator family protein [Smithellaceae bacterium]MBP8608832.1 septum formation initiator family protein [Syntrophaceae bacterium]HNT90178.1 septum formation initiator family protein [Smithellaceae bacterium]